MPQDTERRPLLERHGSGSRGLVEEEVDGGLQDRRFSGHHSPLFICCLCAVVLLMVEIGGIMQITPLNQVTEEIICHNFAPNISLTPELRHRCKEAEFVTLSIFSL